MAGFKKPTIPRHEAALWETRLDDVVGPEDNVRLIELIFRSEPFASVFRAWEQDYELTEGREPFHPRYLASLYVYGMLSRIRSSRGLEQACRLRIDFMWLMEGQTPDHTTIFNFFKRFKSRLGDLLKSSIELGIRAGLISFQLAGIDGTKFAANASRTSVKNEETLRKEKEQLEKAVEQLQRQFEEAEEEQQPCGFTESDSKAEKHRRALKAKTSKLERVQQAMNEIARRREECVKGGAKPVNSPTDPDSRPMPDKQGTTRPCYNVQVVADAETGMLTAVEVNDHPNDEGQLLPMLDASEDNCGQSHKKAAADSGYTDGPTLEKLEQGSTEVVMPMSGQRKIGEKLPEDLRRLREKLESGQRFTQEELDYIRGNYKVLPKDLFIYDETKDAYICPNGETLVPREREKVKRGSGEVERKRYSCKGCKQCPYAAYCCPGKTRRRRIARDEYEECRERHRKKMETPEAKVLYKKRSHLAETPFAMIKHNLGVRQLLHRGQDGARGEVNLVATAVNLLKCVLNWGRVQQVLA